MKGRGEKRQLPHLASNFYTQNNMGNIDPNAEIMPKQPNILKEEYGPAKDNLPIFSRPVESGYIESQGKEEEKARNLPRPKEELYDSLAGAEYFTQEKSYIPASDSIFTAYDQGISSPRYLRLSATMIPTTAAQAKEVSLPLGCVCQPFALSGGKENQMNIPLIELGAQIGGIPLRCEECRAYVNPGTEFKPKYKFICNICGKEQNIPEGNDLHQKYKGGVDTFGKLVNHSDDLKYGTYDLVAPPTYNMRTIKDFKWILLLETTPHAIQTGVVAFILNSVINSLDYMPPQLKIGIISFDTSLHFYTLNKDATELQNVVMNDLKHPFVPLPPDKIFLSIAEHKEKKLQEFYDKQRNESQLNPQNLDINLGLNCMGSGIEAASLSIGENGQILIFASSMCNIGLGGLRIRNSKVYYDTDTEKSLLVGESEFYKLCGNKGIEKNIGINYFLTPGGEELDLPTIIWAAGMTGGSLFYYEDFSLELDSEKLYNDIFHVLTRIYVYDVAITVRCAPGITVSNYYGGFYHRPTSELLLAIFDPDKTLSFTFMYTGETINTESVIPVQMACLYRTLDLETRVRVFNTYVTASHDDELVIKSAEIEATTRLLGCLGLTQMLKSKISQAREQLVGFLISILTNYRESVKGNLAPKHLIIPDSLNILPLYVLSLLKSPALLSLHQVKLDIKAKNVMDLFSSSFPKYLRMLYPKMYNISPIFEGEESQIGELTEAGVVLKPRTEPLDLHRLKNGDLGNICLIDKGESIYLTISEEVSPSTLERIFGTGDLGNIRNASGGGFAGGIPQIDNLVDRLRQEVLGEFRGVLLLVQGGLRWERVIKLMIETQLTKDKQDLSYHEFLQYLHKYISGKLRDKIVPA